MSIKIGSNDAAFKIGATNVNKIYKGSSSVWEPTPTGYTLTVNFSAGAYGGDSINEYKIKAGNAPTGENDCDYYLDYNGAGNDGVIYDRNGIITSIGVSGSYTLTIPNVSTYWYWADYAKGTMGGSASPTYANKRNVTLSAAGSLAVVYPWDD